jgi:hypothetical protein
LQWHDVSHKAFFAVDSKMSLIFPPCILLFRMCIFWHGSLIMTYSASYCTCAKAPMYYQGYSDYLSLANLVDSHKLEDCSMTDKLLLMLQVTAEVLWKQQIFYFYSGEVTCGLYVRYCLFQVLDLKF